MTEDESKIELEVTDAGNRYDKSRVPLSKSKLEKIGILSGDKVSVVTEKNRVVGFAWPEENTDDTIPLSREEQEHLGVTPGSKVYIVPGGSEGTKRINRSDRRDAVDYSNLSENSETKDNSKKYSNRESEDSDSHTYNAYGELSYDDVGGLNEEVKQIRRIVELPLNRPDLFENVGIKPPKGVLLHGPPGTGKTLIAQAIANEVDARFSKIDGPEVMSKYTGESEAKLRKIFKDARESGPAIIFFDEIDSFGSERDGDDDVQNRMVGQLLSLMDGLNSEENVIVIGATNRVDTIDPALRRSGRFDREIHIGVPNEKDRKEILEIHTEDMPLEDTVSIDSLAEQTNGFVGADLEALTREAALESLHRTFENNEQEVFDGEIKETKVGMSEFNVAMGKVDPSSLRDVTSNTPTVNYSDVGGIDEQKKFLEQVVAWPMNRTQLFNKTNTSAPTGVIIEGEESIGKTHLIEATAGEFDINLTKVNASEIFEKYVGQSEEQVEKVFRKAKQASPVILFFEQMDSIASSNNVNTSDAQQRVTSQIISELKAIENDPTITVVAETTDVDNIDSKLRDSGIFEEVISIEKPDGSERSEIIEILLEDKPVGDNVSIAKMASETEGATGGDIRSIIRDASLRAIREHASGTGSNASPNSEEVIITNKHFKKSIEKILEKQS